MREGTRCSETNVTYHTSKHRKENHTITQQLPETCDKIPTDPDKSSGHTGARGPLQRTQRPPWLTADGVPKELRPHSYWRTNRVFK